MSRVVVAARAWIGTPYVHQCLPCGLANISRNFYFPILNFI